MKSNLFCAYVACVLGYASISQAHHSYAMFDSSNGTRTVSGTVAKLEWKNPHVFIWVYVPSQAPGKYDLWAFENGSPSVLSKHGWSTEALKAGEKITMEYWPLRDGSMGGHCEKATRSDGQVLQCASDLGRAR